MASEKSISMEIAALKQKVKEVIGEVNALKAQLEKREITLDVFKEKKEVLEDKLRGILDQIAQYKEKGSVETKKDASIAAEANKLMYDFQTEFDDYISRPKVFLSASVDDHFVFDIDYTNYPEKPTLKSPETLQKLFEVPFNTKITLLNKWIPQNPPHIVEIFYEIEKILLKIFQGDDLEEFDLNQRRLRKILQRRKLLSSAEYEMGLKNFDKALELYQRIVQVCYEIEDFEQANKYTKLIADLKKQNSEKEAINP